MNRATHNQPPVILIVDDEKSLRLVLRRAMEHEGYKVIEAGNGKECLTICQEYGETLTLHPPDIILLDALMPIMNGFACCSQLHNNLGLQCPPVLMITALHDKESVDQAFEAGATDYITKPIHWAVLRQRVRRLLETQWATQEQERLLTELRETMTHERFLKEQLEIANQKLAHLAALDGLTHIANRRCFDSRLHREWERLAWEQAPLALILCDIDFFKAYNDCYGHLAGDECLQQVANVLRHVVKRPTDLVARYGGEEFVVLLPNMDLEGAIQHIELIQEDLKAEAIAHTRSPISSSITLSIGIASTIPQVASSPTDLIAYADQALYQAKLEGRNRYCVYRD